jgi:hypothetical protein
MVLWSVKRKHADNFNFTLQVAKLRVTGRLKMEFGDALKSVVRFQVFLHFISEFWQSAYSSRIRTSIYWNVWDDKNKTKRRSVVVNPNSIRDVLDLICP